VNRSRKNVSWVAPSPLGLRALVVATSSVDATALRLKLLPDGSVLFADLDAIEVGPIPANAASGLLAGYVSVENLT
jgi:hypothetical protein